MTAFEKKLKRKRMIKRITEKVVNACVIATIAFTFAEISMAILILLLWGIGQDGIQEIMGKKENVTPESCRCFGGYTSLGDTHIWHIYNFYNLVKSVKMKKTKFLAISLQNFVEKLIELNGKDMFSPKSRRSRNSLFIHSLSISRQINCKVI